MGSEMCIRDRGGDTGHDFYPELDKQCQAQARNRVLTAPCPAVNFRLRQRQHQSSRIVHHGCASAARGPRRSALLRGRESVETRMRRVRTHAQLRPQGISIAITKATPADRRRAEQPRRGARRPPRLTHTRQGRPTKHAPSEHRKQGWRASRGTMNRHHGLVKHSYWARQNRHQGIIWSRLRDANI